MYKHKKSGFRKAYPFRIRIIYHYVNKLVTPPITNEPAAIQFDTATA